MPIYVYTCPNCELEIEEMRPISLADAPMWCPACGAECGRGITNVGALVRRSQGAGEAAFPSGKPLHRAGCPCCYPIRR